MANNAPKLEEPQSQRHPPTKLEWVSPAIVDLPRLADLTLQTGMLPGECGPGGGSTCF